MFILYAVILGIMTGYITGGRLKNMMQRSFRWVWLAVSAFFLQLMLFSGIRAIEALPDTTKTVLHCVSYICLLVFAARNFKIPGMAVIGLGIFCNALVITLNGGYMPTLPENLQKTTFAKYAEAISQNVVVHNSRGMTAETLLPWLGDIFRLPAWLPLSNVFSIGDVIIAIGIGLYFTLNMRTMNMGKPESPG